MNIKRLEANYIMTDIECHRKIISQYMNDLYNFDTVTTVPTSQVFIWIGNINRNIRKLNDLIE